MRKALGRGLNALIAAEDVSKKEEGMIRVVPIDKIHPSHLQARKNFDPEKLAELASSIKRHGLAQPLLVSHDASNGSYELIAGERRLRACVLAGIGEVEVIVRELSSEKNRMIVGLIENLQREDLNAIEEALSYLRLMREFQISQTDLTHIVGKSKSAVSNTLRLLELPEEIQKAVQFGKLTEGHARALLMTPDALERNKLFRRILESQLSVREVEDLARATHGAKVQRVRKFSRAQNPDVFALENELQEILGTRVEIRARKSGDQGRLIVHFYNLEDFDRILQKIKK